MLSIIGILAVLTLLLTVGSAIGKVPLWVPVLLLSIIALLGVLPLR